MEVREAGVMDKCPSGDFNQRLHQDGREAVKGKNTHPTVKPLSLAKYLCRLVGSPDAIILDPFCGSGSIPLAAYLEGMHFIGIEQEQEYVTIARARLAHATKEDTRKASLAEHNGK